MSLGAKPLRGVRACATYYRGLTRALLDGDYLPSAEPALVPWHLATAVRLWSTVCRIEGDTFAEYLQRSGVRLPLGLMRRRAPVVALVYAWPVLAALLTWRHRGARLEQWTQALLRPDLYAAFPRVRFSAQAVRERRADMLFAIANAWDYTVRRSPDYAIEDKRVFAERAGAAGLPVVPTLSWDEALARGGPYMVKDPARDMGLGVRRVETAAELAALGAAAGLLIQPVLANHPALAPVLPERAPLCTLRLLTTLRRGGAGTHIAYLRIGAGGSVVDNLSRGGTLVEVELASGRLSRGVPYAALQGQEPVGQGIAQAPGARAPFAGVALPAFAAAVALVERAHGAIAPTLLSVGWDVALTPEGPVLVEANVFAGSYEILQFNQSYAIGNRAILDRLQEARSRRRGGA